MPKGRKCKIPAKGKKSQGKLYKGNKRSVSKNSDDQYDNLLNLSLTNDENKVVIRGRNLKKMIKKETPSKKGQNKAPNNNQVGNKRNSLRKVKLSYEKDELDSDEEEDEENFDSEVKNDYYIENSEEESVYKEKSHEDSSSFDFNEDNFDNNQEKQLTQLQKTKYQSRRLTKRQKAVLKNSGIEHEKDDNNGEQSWNDYEDELMMNHKMADKKKKNKNIQTFEEKEKKIEMEEKRKAHIAKMNEEHKQNIVKKILNENRNKQVIIMTEYTKKLALRKEKLKTQRFPPNDLIVQYKSTSTGTSLIIPRSVTIKQLIEQNLNDINYDWINSYPDNFVKPTANLDIQKSPKRKTSLYASSNNMIIKRKNSQRKDSGKSSVGKS